MMQPGMHRSRIYEVSHSHLVDPSQPLVIRMRNELVDQFIINGNKTINRIVDNFMKRHWLHECFDMLKELQSKVKLQCIVLKNLICLKWNTKQD